MENFFERYEIIEIVGKGATATVYLAWDRRVFRFVAIKAGTDRELLLQEARYQATMNSKYFPVLFDCVEVGRQICLIMEYLEGENLMQRKKRIGRYGEAEAISIAGQVAEAMGEIHNGAKSFIYGDIKPENIIMQKDGNVKVVDFGAMVPLEPCKTNLLQVRGGTPAFAAPEQWSGIPDIRNDIYGLGMLMRDMLSQDGKLHCGQNVSRLIERCIQKQKEKRFESMVQFLDLCAKNAKNKILNEKR